MLIENKIAQFLYQQNLHDKCHTIKQPQYFPIFIWTFLGIRFFFFASANLGASLQKILGGFICNTSIIQMSFETHLEKNNV